MAGSLQPDPILQSRLTDPPWALRAGTKLPGTGPVEADDWIRADDAFAEQMALRDRLIAERQEAVHTLRPAALYWVRIKNFCDINHDPKALGRVLINSPRPLILLNWQFQMTWVDYQLARRNAY